MGWEWAFYIFGIVGLVWFIFWYRNVTSYPSDHQRITAEELAYIQESASSACSNKGAWIPGMVPRPRGRYPVPGGGTQTPGAVPRPWGRYPDPGGGTQTPGAVPRHEGGGAWIPGVVPRPRGSTQTPGEVPRPWGRYPDSRALAMGGSRGGAQVVARG